MQLPRLNVEDLNYWHAIALFFAIVTMVSALGEWVFHWWDEPGELLSFVGLLATVLAAGFAASKVDIRRLGDRQKKTLELQEKTLETQNGLLAGQRRQTELLEELVRSFREAQGARS